jgi:hypothetical protein
MKLFRNASALAMAIIVTGTTANAYSLAEAAEPRERPPAGYSSDVYVDSRGCAYVRANIGNFVNWVPRLTGDRKQVVCGMTPSANVRRAAAVAPPAPLVAAPVAPVQPASPPAMTLAAAAPAAPAAAVRTLTVTCPADGSEARVRVGNSTIRVTCAPGQTRSTTHMVSHPNGDRTRLIVNPSPNAPGPLPLVTARAPATIVAPAAMLPTGSARVRIGGVPPGGASNNFGSGYGVGVGGTVAAPVPVIGTGLPVTTYRAPSATPAPAAPAFGSGYGLPVQPGAGRVYIPAGYRPAWDDDRLNPNRGPQTALGDAQMAALWTDDLPMRPVAGAGAVISTRGVIAPPPAPTPQATGARYVQVGVFGNPANATAAANKLAGLGLPGRIGKTASGQSVVLAGPFTDAGALQNALSVARRNGFSDAFTRG